MITKQTGAPTGTRPNSARQLHYNRRQWCFRLLAIALALVPFLALELVFRTFGVGNDTKFVVRAHQANSPTVWQFNPKADLAYYGVQDVAGPEARPFELPKPASIYRIVVVGGSTVAGFPYPFELALPRQLEVVLSEQLPDMQFEVLNAGITSINSSSEVDIVRQLLADAEPDLVVVHSGHNEFYGPGGSASTTSRFGVNFHKLMQGIRRQRTYQLAMAAIPRSHATHLVETLPAEIDIPLHSPLFEQTIRNYRSNLTQIIDMAESAKVPILITTVPSNLRNLAPLAPPIEDDLIVQLGAAESHMSYQEFAEAFVILEAAESTYPLDALLTFRKGQCLEGLGRLDAAAEAFALAADLDGCRFRAPGDLLDVVRQLASTRSNTMFCDVAKELQLRSKYPAPGDDFFLEHVHYNFLGTWEAASILAQAIVEQALKSPWYTERLPPPQKRDELLGVASLDHLAADSLSLIILRAWPLNLSPARVSEMSALEHRIAETFSRLAPQKGELFSTLDMGAMEHSLWMAMGERWLAVNRPEQAYGAFKRHIQRKPWDSQAYLGAASAMSMLGNDSESQLLRNQAAVCFRPTQLNP